MISIICPTRNESGNIRLLLKKINDYVKIKYEIIFVDDDSSDGTVEIIKKISKKNSDVRVISRFKEKNLSSAVALGISSAKYDYVIVIDADLQHDIANINTMYEVAIKQNMDLVISSRFVDNDEKGYSKNRELLSIFGNKVINKVLSKKLSDPLSGCFLIKTSFFNTIKHKLILRGYKILFDILTSCNLEKYNLIEVPIKFHKRHFGESKLSKKVIFDFILSYLLRITNRIIPINFFKFSIVGLFGVGIHLIILNFLLEQYYTSFAISQFIAALITMNLNFYLNNNFTFVEDKLIKYSAFKGLIKFILFCSIGALISARVGSFFFDLTEYTNLSAFIGIVFGSITNYVLNRNFTWKR